ncbi:hypothetical protein [Priestia sp. FSL R5-0680]|uniref:hypothetical protein n=1 Tax=Priestia sp. FSL R5-0680 TaxID=2921582 RepID=UPI0030F6C14E
MKIRPLYLLLGITTILLLVCSPIGINFIVKSKPWFGVKAADNNDWIGFYGSYIGGIITLVALVVTIGYTTLQYRDQDRKRVQPYITIKQLYKNFARDDTVSVEPVMGLVDLTIGQQKKKDDVYFKEFELYGEAKNIGLGTAINIYFDNIYFDNKKINQRTSSYHAIAVGENIVFRFTFLNLILEEEFLNEKYKKQKEEGLIPNVYMNFSMFFDDMLGNRYTQQVKVKIQVIEQSVSPEGEQNPNVLLEKVTYPTLKVSKF